MKNILILLTLFISINFVNAQNQTSKVKFFNDVKITTSSTSKTLTIKVNEENKKFNNVFVLLLKNTEAINNFKDFENLKGNIVFDKKTLKITSGSKSISFSIQDSKEKNVEVLGISRFQGNFDSDEEIRFNPYIGEIISNESLTSRTMQCTAGGPGSNQCGVSSEIMGVMTQCEVSCNTGYYACCDDGIGKCKCVQNGKLPPKSLEPAKISTKLDKEIIVSFSKNKTLFLKGIDKDYNLIIVDLNGNDIKNLKINQFNNTFDLNALNFGLYFYKIVDSNNKTIKQGKILIQ